jgi:hypothetical protein
MGYGVQVYPQSCSGPPHARTAVVAARGVERAYVAEHLPITRSPERGDPVARRENRPTSYERRSRPDERDLDWRADKPAAWIAAHAKRLYRFDSHILTQGWCGPLESGENLGASAHVTGRWAWGASKSTTQASRGPWITDHSRQSHQDRRDGSHVTNPIPAHSHRGIVRQLTPAQAALHFELFLHPMRRGRFEPLGVGQGGRGSPCGV